MNRRVAAVLALAALISALCVSAASAQEEKPLRFGLKLGVNISDFRGNDVEGAGELIDWKTGFCGGVFVSYAFNDWFSLQPEALYSMKGMKLGIFTASAMTFSLDYVEFPVLAVAKIPLEGVLKPYFFAGPVFGFNVRAEFSANIFDEDIEVDLSDYVATAEFSLAFGGGLNIGIAGRQIPLEFRYVPGLTNIFDESLMEAGEEFEWNNDTISILTGFTF